MAHANLGTFHDRNDAWQALIHFAMRERDYGLEQAQRFARNATALTFDLLMRDQQIVDRLLWDEEAKREGHVTVGNLRFAVRELKA